MIVCSKCGHQDVRGVIVFTPAGTIEYCRIHVPRSVRSNPDVAKNPFENFTLDNVRDERGQKVTVNSIAELRAAEKRHNFALAVASDDGGRADKPPQHEPWAGDITHNYKRKWQRNPEAYKPENVTGVSAGVAQSTADTLVDHPRPLK